VTDACRLAAIVFDRDETPDPPLVDFVAAAMRNGVRVAGLVQERAEDDRCDRHDVRVRDLVSGEILAIMQDLGPEATGCRVDPSAIAIAARLLYRALETRPDLLVVNRFGRLESEGGGVLAEIGTAFAEGVALIVCVPKRYSEAWNAFAAGLDAQLPPSRAAIEDWWASVAPGVSASGTIDA
jgi:nucleoside-triphosphatase THEP1